MSSRTELAFDGLPEGCKATGWGITFNVSDSPLAAAALVQKPAIKLRRHAS